MSLFSQRRQCLDSLGFFCGSPLMLQVLCTCLAHLPVHGKPPGRSQPSSAPPPLQMSPPTQDTLERVEEEDAANVRDYAMWVQDQSFSNMNLSIKELVDCDTIADQGCIGGKLEQAEVFAYPINERPSPNVSSQWDPCSMSSWEARIYWRPHYAPIQTLFATKGDSQLAW